MAQTVMERREARARREGRQEGEELALQRAVKRAIRTRFPTAAANLTDRVGLFQEATALEELLSRVILASSLEEIERLLAGPPAPS